MKQFANIPYTFNAAAKTVTISIAGFNIQGLMAIINQTAGKLIYQTGSETLKYTSVAGTVVTLLFDTTAMNNADVLQIVYDDSLLPASESTLLEVRNHLDTVETKLQSLINQSPAAWSLGTGNVDAATQRVTLAADGAANINLLAIKAKTDNLDVPSSTISKESTQITAEAALQQIAQLLSNLQWLATARNSLGELRVQLGATNNNSGLQYVTQLTNQIQNGGFPTNNIVPESFNNLASINNNRLS